MATDTVHRAFSDKRAFVVPNEGRDLEDPIRSELQTSQAEDGPTFIRVGVECTDAYLREAWEDRKRFVSVTLEQLLAARDNRVQRSEVQHG